MTINNELLNRNQDFAKDNKLGSMPALPTLGVMVLTCVDTRVDPAHVLGLQLGEAVVFRNNGGRVTRAFIDELAALSMMVGRITGEAEPRFDIVLMQHTNCGAQSFADPDFRADILEATGVDVSETAITNQKRDLLTDLDRLRDATTLPDSLTVSALLFDVETGRAHEMAAPRRLSELRKLS